MRARRKHTNINTKTGLNSDSLPPSAEDSAGTCVFKKRGTMKAKGQEDHPRILSWECVQDVRYGFEGRNGKNRRHLIGNKSFSV